MNTKQSAPSTGRDWRLIRQYVDGRSDAAFAELLGQYLGFVYAVCRRELGDGELAQDAAQAVFLVLAAKAHSFRQGIVLSTWLFETSRLTCRNAIRTRRRRQRHEERVFSEMAHRQSHFDAGDAVGLAHPGVRGEVLAIDDALSSLSQSDRTLVLLRFFEGCSLAEAGLEMGLSEDAARMRVSRAVEKMRKYFARQGISVTASALTTLFGSEDARMPPAALNDAIAFAVREGAAAGSVGASVHELAKGVMKRMLIQKCATAVVLAAAGCGCVGVVTAMAKAIGHPARPAVIRSHAAVDPRAMRAMTQMLATYAGLSTYSDTETGAGDMALGMPYTADFSYARPDRAEFIVTKFGKKRRLVADAHYLYDIDLGSAQTYTRLPRHSDRSAAEEIASHVDVKFPLTAIFLMGGGSELKTGLLPALEKSGLTLGPTAVIDGVETDSVIVGKNEGTYVIGHSDHLLRKITIDNGPTVSGPGYSATIEISNIKANPVIPASEFAFEPEAGWHGIDQGLHKDPRAIAIMRTMYDTYNKMQSFSYVSDCTLYPPSQPGSPSGEPIRLTHGTHLIKQTNKVRFDITYTMPNDYNYGKETVVADGGAVSANVTGRLADASHYLEQALDQDDRYNGEVQIINASDFFMEMNERFMPDMALHYDWMPADGDYDFTDGGETTLDGLAMDTIVIPGYGGGPTVTLLIGHVDHLLHQVTERGDNGSGGTNVTVEKYTELIANPTIPDSLFWYTPPPGATEVGDVNQLMARRP